MYRKGTILLRKKIIHPSVRSKQVILPLHVDMIQDKFWEEHNEILNISKPTTYNWPESQDVPNLILAQIR